MNLWPFIQFGLRLVTNLTVIHSLEKHASINKNIHITQKGWLKSGILGIYLIQILYIWIGVKVNIPPLYDNNKKKQFKGFLSLSALKNYFPSNIINV